jgi:hypothetical protein
MAKFQSYKRIIPEDYDEEIRDTISKLAYSINPAMEDIQNAFNNNLTISDNLNIYVKDFIVTVDANGAPTTTTNVRTGLTYVSGTQVINAFNLDDPSSGPTGLPFIKYSNNGNLITINSITNLQTGEKYKIRAIFYP